MSHVLYCPGRTTVNHNQLLSEYGRLSEYRFLVLDTATAALAYASGSGEIVLCTNERYQLEMHKFLTIAPAFRYIKDLWEGTYDYGQDWRQRGKYTASLNHTTRPRIMKTWDDLAHYYCILAMSDFRVNFRKWRMVAEHTPVTPNYSTIREWSQKQKTKTIRYYRRNVYKFPTTELDDRTVIYVHIPDNFAPYGCGYAWTRRKLDHIAEELNYFAGLGQPVIVSLTHGRWGKRNTGIEEMFPAPLFHAHYYVELKADKPGFNPQPLTEAYLVANLG